MIQTLTSHAASWQNVWSIIAMWVFLIESFWFYFGLYIYIRLMCLINFSSTVYPLVFWKLKCLIILGECDRLYVIKYTPAFDLCFLQVIQIHGSPDFVYYNIVVTITEL